MVGFRTMMAPALTLKSHLMRSILQFVGFVRVGGHGLIMGVAAWRAWLALGANDVKRRYRRSRLGQLWFTLSMILFIFGLATILGGLFKSNIAAILPWFAINMVFWTFLSTVITETSNAFVEAEPFIKQVNVPVCAYIIRVIHRNILILGHNIIIIPLVLFYTWTAIDFTAFLAFIGLFLLVLQLTWVGILLATLTARFRDIPQVVQSVVQLLFFVTPIMFKPDQMSPELWWWLQWNPLQSHLALIRQPILGEMPLAWDYEYVLLIMVFGFLVSLAFFGRFRNRVVYWI